MKEQKGITLIALIITIIILVIISVVTIGNINGEGTIKRAENTATTYNVETAKADLKMAVTQCYSLYGNLDNLANFLDNNIWTLEKTIIVTSNGSYAYEATTKDGYSFFVQSNGTIELKNNSVQ